MGWKLYYNFGVRAEVWEPSASDRRRHDDTPGGIVLGIFDQGATWAQETPQVVRQIHAARANADPEGWRFEHPTKGNVLYRLMKVEG